MRKLNLWVPLREPKWHTSVCPSIHLPPPPPPPQAGSGQNIYIFDCRKGKLQLYHIHLPKFINWLI